MCGYEKCPLPPIAFCVSLTTTTSAVFWVQECPLLPTAFCFGYEKGVVDRKCLLDRYSNKKNAPCYTKQGAFSV